MADKPLKNRTVKLIDGTEIEVRPLKLSLLRPFMSKFALLSSVSEDNDKSMDILIECAQIAMKQFKPELAEDRAALEELLDLPTVYEIIDAASGVQNNETSAVLTSLTK
ncbi:MAG: hypothetical protein AN484_01250 [Aphanizomenon flos-aquae WA102]|uniref:Phage tail assembly protein n=1 Tax=Aphanizomenon flos-aquae WA102 TaxID=1710896 RepID=A0A1B7X8G6_APHFL|nr:MAG: hypothetical protein AN484_01250 [Aphanizomenon flos-aquae WA102]